MVGMVSVVALMLALLLAALEVGFRAGRSRRKEDRDKSYLGTVQGGVLGLLGLLLGFSFAGAATRFVERQDLIVQQANALGTAYLRADMLGEPSRSALRQGLRDYTDAAINLFKEGGSTLTPAQLTSLESRHAPIWSAAVEGVRADPVIGVLVLPPVNEVIDLFSVRVASARRHLPPMVLGLLLACALIALFTVGYGAGLTNQRHLLMTLTLAVLVSTALATTLDLDYPRRGVITLSDAPLIDARRGMGE